MATSPAFTPPAPRRMFPALAWLLKRREASSAGEPPALHPGTPNDAPNLSHRRPAGASFASTPGEVRSLPDRFLRAERPGTRQTPRRPGRLEGGGTGGAPDVYRQHPAGRGGGGSGTDRSRWAAQHHPGSAEPQPPQALSDDLLDLSLLISCLPRWLHPWLVAQLQPLVAWRRAQPRALADLLRAYPPPDPQQGRLGRLRAELRSALLIGLVTAAAPLAQVSRPTRNRALVEEAERLAAVAAELARRPDAEPLEQEFAWALASIRR